MNENHSGEFANFHEKLEEKIRQSCPSLEKWPLKEWLSVVASPHSIDLPRSIAKRVENAVAAFYRLSRLPLYIQHVAQEHGSEMALNHPQASVLMAYDFHYDPETDRLGLIEINTNASGYLITSFLKGSDTAKSQTRLWDSFCDEMGGAPSNSTTLAIVDDQPPQQKMYLEFLMYRDFFRAQKVQADIWDVSDLSLAPPDGPLMTPQGQPVSFVYNRWNDFTFKSTEAQNFARAYRAGTTRFSPHPREYLLLADKTRMTEWSQETLLANWGAEKTDQQAISSVLLKTKPMASFKDPEELWKNRKSLFFKPARSFGSKSAYRGTSITKKVFARLLSEDTLVQDFLPAPEVSFAGQEKPWKYDLRFFVYRDQVQLMAARLYRGQVTNFGPVGGGFAAIRLT